MRPSDRTIRLLKMSLAAGLAWYLASLVSPHRNPYFAPLAVVITFQSTVADTVAKAWYRVAGIVGGVAVALLISQWLHVGAVTIALAVLIGVAIASALRLDPQIISQVGVTVVMVLASSATPHYAEYRIFETLLGAVVGVVVNALLMPRNGLTLAEERVLAVADLLTTNLSNLAQAPQAPSVIAKQIEAHLSSAAKALRAAEAGLKLNPFAHVGRARVRQLATALAELEKIGIQVRGIARGLNDLGPRIDACRADLGASMVETAESVATFGRAVAHPCDEAFRAVAVAVAQAQSTQTECLTHLKERTSLADLRDLSAVLADLDRILAEVRAGLPSQTGQLAVHHSVAFGHD